MVTPDIRATFACVLAAATASSPSLLSGVEQLERGYDDVATKFRSLGLVIDGVAETDRAFPSIGSDTGPSARLSSVDLKKLVADGYDRLYSTYADWGRVDEDGVRHHYVDGAFELGLRAPARALDLGCGTGRHATAYLVARGLDVTGMDISCAQTTCAWKMRTARRPASFGFSPASRDWFSLRAMRTGAGDYL